MAQAEAKYVNQMRLNQGINLPKTGKDRYRVKHQPGLYLIVRSSGHMSWSASYRVAGKLIKQTRPMAPVDEAVRWARDFADQAKQGIDPVEERRIADEGRRIEAERDADNTVAAAIDAWLAECERNLRPKSVRGYRQLMDHDVRPAWGNRPLSSITKADVLVLINNKASKRERSRKGTTGGSSVQANRLLTRLRTFFGWCVANDLVTADPTAGVRKPAAEASRERVLDDAEIKAFWTATGALDAARRDAVAIGPLFRMMLLTAQRESEVAGMRWSEIDLAKREWTIPGHRVKNGKAHVVHLSDLALEVLAATGRRDDLVFSSTGRMPATFGRAKVRLDDAMAKAVGNEVEPWVLHDLRRTATSCMARLEVLPHVADRVLNHTAGSIRGVAATYNRFQYLDERRMALEALARFVGLLVRDRLPGHVAEARTKQWLRRERVEREVDSNVVELEPKITATA